MSLLWWCSCLVFIFLFIFNTSFLDMKVFNCARFYLMPLISRARAVPMQDSAEIQDLKVLAGFLV